jgi:hypothetical protein
MTAGLALLALPVQATGRDAPLPSGHPAGLSQAQMNNHQLEYVIIGVGTVIMGLGAVWWVNKKNDKTPAATSTSP